jgi:zinc D-Ala-D-Ala dipeptidase
MEDRLLRERKLSGAQLGRRRLLRRIMSEAGFRPLALEWWHFESGDKGRVRRELPIVE